MGSSCQQTANLGRREVHEFGRVGIASPLLRSWAARTAGNADLEEVLDTTENRLACTLQRKAGHYSAHNGSAGFPTAAGTWVRLAWRRPDWLNSQGWTGFEAAAALTGVPQPEWFAAASWSDSRLGVV